MRAWRRSIYYGVPPAARLADAARYDYSRAEHVGAIFIVRCESSIIFDPWRLAVQLRDRRCSL